MSKKIFIILPYKESLNPEYAGAVSLYVKDTSRYSKYKNNIKIISSEKIYKEKFFRNRNYILDFCRKYKNSKIDIIEIHNRPEYLKYIKEFFPNAKINLFFHNDPLSLRGSESEDNREFIIKNSNKIIFISRWVQKMFYSSLKNIDMSNSELNIVCDLSGNPIGIRKSNFQLYDYNYNLILFEERYNVLSFIGGNCGMLYSR